MTELDKLTAAVIACRKCPRLVRWREAVARHPPRRYQGTDYWAKPLGGFGDPKARLLIVGLAPAAHGGNRTGRIFTGDRSGDWLYRALHKAGFANQPESVSLDDGLRLTNCVVTAAAHCAPPANKLTPRELINCREWLDATFDLLNPVVIVALGQIAFRVAIMQSRRKEWLAGSAPKFSHGAVVALKDDHWVIASYHPSQ